MPLSRIAAKVPGHVEERLPLVVRFGLFGPVKALYGVLAILIG